MKVKGTESIQERQKKTANRNMLKHWIAVIELRTVSVLQETRQIAIQYVVARIRARG
jgi:hypothetical protein